MVLLIITMEIIITEEKCMWKEGLLLLRDLTMAFKIHLQITLITAIVIIIIAIGIIIEIIIVATAVLEIQIQTPTKMAREAVTELLHSKIHNDLKTTVDSETIVQAIPTLIPTVVVDLETVRQLTHKAILSYKTTPTDPVEADSENNYSK